MNSINEADKPKVTKQVVVYSGRFQPFHKGHYATYAKLVSQFGANNVYIGTSNDTSSDKSPFNFNEKKKIATTMFGIPSSKFIRVGNPYAPKEILSKFDGKTTQYIAAVGEKDANRLHGKYFKPYKGKAGYGYEEIGYVYPVPAEQNPISGTDVRNGLGSNDVEKSKKFFLKAYPKFDKDIYKMITGKLNEDGMPGGIGVGLTLPNGYINGAPTGSNNEIYDPISELIGRVAAEEIFEDFVKDYFNEAGNKALDVDISYTNSKGEQKKIKARDALRLPKDHPAHIQAAKIAGPDDAPVNEPKPKEQPGKAAAQSVKPAEPGQPVKKDQTAQGKSDKAKDGKGGEEKQAPPPNKLSGAELKSSAEKPPVDPREKETKQQLDKEVAKLSNEDQATAKEMNDPNSESRKSTAKNIGDWFKKKGEGLWDGAKHWAHEKKEMVTGSIDSVKSLYNSGGKLGYKKNEETGKYEYSKDEHHKQKHALKHLGKDVMLLGASMIGAAAIGGAIGGGIAAAKAAGAHGIGTAIAHGAGHGAVHGVTGLVHHGATGFAAHLGKDLVKHSFFETMGLGGASAAGATATVGVIGSLMEGEGDDDGAKFVDKVVSKTLEKMSTYQMTNQQMLDSIRRYNENKPKKDLEDLLKENISETKQQTIEHFVEWATGRLKLKEQPKVNLIGGGEFAETKTSLGGYDPLTKEIFVAIEGRLGADILRTLAHEMVHRKQDEMGLVRNESDGNDGSPIENNAHAVAGILMREYGRINKQIYTEDINIDVDKGDTVLMGKFKNKKVTVKDFGKDDHGMPTINGKKATTFRMGDKSTDEVSSSDWHFKAIMKLYDKAGSFGKKKIASVICANPNANRNQIARELRYSDYKEVTDYTDKLGLHEIVQKKTLNEGLLLEGGAYGHMSHPFDDMDLTFGDLKNIISKALNGDLGVVREKTDGQALAISWKNGRLIAARNKGHLANAGANAMGIADVASKFNGRGALTDAYNFAMRDLTAAVGSLSDAQRKKIFNEGRCFMNLEVIWPTSVNVIPYGQAILVFHNTTCYDDKGTAIGANQGAASQLAGMIKQVNAHVQSKYTIQGPPVTSIPKNENLSAKQGKYLGRLSKLQSQFGLSDGDNVANYHQAWWENFIDTKSPEKVDKLTRDALVRRWAFGEKAFRLDKNNITNEKILAWAINNDKVNVAKQQKDNIRPFEEIFLGVGADILDFVSSVLTVHPDKAIRAMKDKFKSVADQVRTAGNPAQIAKLKAELARLNKLGGVDRIVASEGLVFFYNGKTYKLTGTFAPLNQILGIFYA